MRPAACASALLLVASAGCDGRLAVGQLAAPSVGTSDADPPVFDASHDVDAASDQADEAAPPPECGAGDADEAGTPMLDIIFMVDNSSSVRGIIEKIAHQLSVELPKAMEQRGIDYRLILLSRYGSTTSTVGHSESPICISAPLGTTDCSDPAKQPLQNHPPRFFQYSMDVDSNPSFCLLAQSWSSPDEIPAGDRIWAPVAPKGWSEFVRAEAFKAIVVITDDEVVCDYKDFHFNGWTHPEAVPAEFDRLLGSLSPTQFGTPAHRNYKFFSIVGMRANDPATTPWPASAPIQTELCDDELDQPGASYQGVSILTGGVRYSICQGDNYIPVFEAMADAARPPPICP